MNTIPSLSGCGQASLKHNQQPRLQLESKIPLQPTQPTWFSAVFEFSNKYFTTPFHSYVLAASTHLSLPRLRWLPHSSCTTSRPYRASSLPHAHTFRPFITFLFKSDFDSLLGSFCVPANSQRCPTPRQGHQCLGSRQFRRPPNYTMLPPSLRSQ